MDHADDVITIHFVKGILQEKSRTLGRESFSLEFRRERPTDLEPGPSLGISESDTANEAPGRFLFDRVVSVTKQLPMSDDERHVTPCVEPRHRLPSDQVSHDIGIGAQPIVILKVAEAIRAKNETLGLVPDVVHFRRCSWCPENEEIPSQDS
jgi:hypothetical protein